MINYNVTFGDEESIRATDDFESVDEVCEFVSEALIEHGEGEWQISVAAFEIEPEIVEDEP